MTVAGVNGADVAAGSVLQRALLSAMQKAGDALVPIIVASYRRKTFLIAAAVKVDPDYVQEKVFAAVEAALRTHFSFDARAFGQAVTLSDAVAVMQGVPGVVAVDVNKLYRAGDPESRQTFLPAGAPQAGAGPGTPPAELLTLDPGPVALTVLP